MEVQNQVSDQQAKKAPIPFGQVKAWRPTSKKKLDHISPMHLLALLWKTKKQHLNLKPAEKAMLSTLIDFVNWKGIARNGYEAYPSGQTLRELTGLSMRSIESSRKSLQDKGWVRITPGKGPGQSNHYLIDGRKIVEAYNLSNPETKIEIGPEGAFAAILVTSPVSKRNTEGLWKGRNEGKPSSEVLQ